MLIACFLQVFATFTFLFVLIFTIGCLQRMMANICILLLFLELLLICTYVVLMDTVREACEQQHDGIECAGTSQDAPGVYASVRDDVDAHRRDKVAAEMTERYH